MGAECCSRSDLLEAGFWIVRSVSHLVEVEVWLSKRGILALLCHNRPGGISCPNTRRSGQLIEPGERMFDTGSGFQFYFADSKRLPKSTGDFGEDVLAVEFSTRVPWVISERPLQNDK